MCIKILMVKNMYIGDHEQNPSVELTKYGESKYIYSEGFV